MSMGPKKRDYPFIDNDPHQSKQLCLRIGEPAIVQTTLYLDYNTRTPLDCKVLNVVNGHNMRLKNYLPLHIEKELIEDSRGKVATMISANKDEIIFTSGSIQTLYLALQNATKTFSDWFSLNFPGQMKGKAHVISTTVEPNKKIDFLQAYAQNNEIDLTLVPVRKLSGYVSVEDIMQAITPFTCLITIAYVIHPTGVFQPLKGISLGLKEINLMEKLYRPLFHSDISVALGKIDVNVRKLGLDYASISGDKIYAPKMGALYFNKQPKNKMPDSTTFWQEELAMEMVNVGFVIGLGQAARLISKNLKSYEKYFINLKKHFEDELVKHLRRQVILLGKGKSLCNVSCMTFLNSDAFERIERSNILCSNMKYARSDRCIQILKECGYPSGLANKTLSVSFGRTTTEQELTNWIQNISRALI